MKFIDYISNSETVDLSTLPKLAEYECDQAIADYYRDVHIDEKTGEMFRRPA